VSAAFRVEATVLAGALGVSSGEASTLPQLVRRLEALPKQELRRRTRGSIPQLLDVYRATNPQTVARLERELLAKFAANFPRRRAA
jgi:hypothetical protein